MNSKSERSVPNGMLFVATDVDAAEELDFNRWYDREHVEERVRIPGFVSGARYSSVEGGRQYLGLYRTDSLGAFTTDAYRAAFGQQTPWSVTNLDRMRNPMRRVCAVEGAVGFGSGAHIVVLPLDGAVQPEVAARLGEELAGQDGFVHSYLLTPDTTLSSPLPRESTDNRQLLPIFVVEASTAAAARALREQAARALGVPAAQGWLLELGWKLTTADLG